MLTDLINNFIFRNSENEIVFLFFSRGIAVILILLFAYVITRFGRIFIRQAVVSIVKTQRESLKKRRDTLAAVFSSTFNAIIWFSAVILILQELNVNILPILAGLGLAGLVISMGARGLVEDYLVGFYIITEDQYRVGEEVSIAGIKGEVRHISLRRTVLKDGEGVIHYIPNGQVTKVSNYSRGKK